MTSNVDQPDYQIGVSSAQKKLATVASGTRTATVGIPPNAETLVLVIPDVTTAQVVTVTGSTTGAVYPYVLTMTTLTGSVWGFAYCDVSSAIDASVDIALVDVPSSQWYVYSDAGVHLTTDMAISQAMGFDNIARPSRSVLIGGVNGTELNAIQVNPNGQQWVVPTVPGTSSGDHPQTDLQYVGTITNTSGDVVAAPGAAYRIRLFSWAMAATTAVNAVIADGNGGTFLGVVGANASVAQTFPGQGVPLSINTALYFGIASGAGNVLVAVTYTVEAV